MIKNLADYFDANQEIYLAEVSYNRIETNKRLNRPAAAAVR